MKKPAFTVIHFNDVYNVEPQTQEPVGGAARFSAALKSFKDENPLILFSGDIFAPSIMSTFTGGKQMVPVLNHLGVHCAVFGNHDFDFGLEPLVTMKNQTNFPWLMSNVMDCETQRPLADGEIYRILEWEGKKIGLNDLQNIYGRPHNAKFYDDAGNLNLDRNAAFQWPVISLRKIGLVEKEWLDTLSTINPDQVIFSDYIEVGQLLVKELRIQGCDYIIALTHMRTPNDIRLAEADTGIDLILGGHDHVYEVIPVKGTHVIKSGTDFRQFSKISVFMDEGHKTEISVETIDVTSKFPEDEDLAQELEKFGGEVMGKMDEVLAHFSVPLDGRFASIRTSETNLGNFICDVMLATLESDAAILNSGTLRSDRLHDAGNFTFRDLRTILPMLDPMLLITLNGKDLLAALENAVSQYPKLEGRFLQVGGIRFAFDPSKPAGQKVDPYFVKVGDEYLELDRVYKVVTKAYLHNGKDGFDMLKTSEILVDEENAPELSIAVQNYFSTVKGRKEKKRKASTHRVPLVPRQLSRRASVTNTPDFSGLVSPSTHKPSLATAHEAHTMTVDELIHEIAQLTPQAKSGAGTPKEYENTINGHEIHSRLEELERGRNRGSRHSLVRQPTLEEIDVMETVASQLAPKIEGRILVLTEEVRQQLLAERKAYEEYYSIKEVDETSPKNTPQATFDEG